MQLGEKTTKQNKGTKTTKQPKYNQKKKKRGTAKKNPTKNSQHNMQRRKKVSEHIKIFSYPKYLHLCSQLLLLGYLLKILISYCFKEYFLAVIRDNASSSNSFFLVPGAAF